LSEKPGVCDFVCPSYHFLNNFLIARSASPFSRDKAF